MYKGVMFQAIILLLSSAAFAHTTITGTLLDHDGKPMPMADVEVMLPGGNSPVDTAAVKTDTESVSYEVVGITKNLHTVNETEREGYVVDNSDQVQE